MGFGGLSVWTLAECEWRAAAVGLQAKPLSQKIRVQPAQSKHCKKTPKTDFWTISDRINRGEKETDFLNFFGLSRLNSNF